MNKMSQPDSLKEQLISLLVEKSQKAVLDICKELLDIQLRSPFPKSSINFRIVIYQLVVTLFTQLTIAKRKEITLSLEKYLQKKYEDNEAIFVNCKKLSGTDVTQLINYVKTILKSWLSTQDLSLITLDNTDPDNQLRSILYVSGRKSYKTIFHNLRPRELSSLSLTMTEMPESHGSQIGMLPTTFNAK